MDHKDVHIWAVGRNKSPLEHLMFCDTLGQSKHDVVEPLRLPVALDAS